MTTGSDRIIKQIYGRPPAASQQREAFFMHAAEGCGPVGMANCGK
jgi:hypothetical protein